MYEEPDGQSHSVPPVIGLSAAPGKGDAWDRPKAVIYLWSVVELLFITNSWQVSSGLRIRMLKLFGAQIGRRVIFRPRTRVKFPWKLHIGNDSWIGEGVWFHNQDHVYVGNDVVISQDTFLTTGSHAHRRDMALITRPITVSDGVWITSRCMILGGAELGQSCLIKPGTVVEGVVPPGKIFGAPAPEVLGNRFHHAS